MIFIIAAEPSADLLGAGLASELLQKDPKLQIKAVAGPKMRKLPIKVLSKMERLSSMGFSDVLFALPRIIFEFFKIRKAILKENPKIIVFIDYPEFNLRLQNSLRKKGYSGKIIHYVCPSIWAWRKNRALFLEKNVDLLLCLLPFETACFSQKKLQVEYVGHPLSAKIKPADEVRQNILALFPGSRLAEIKKNLPIQIATAVELKKEYPELEIEISISHPKFEALIREIAQNVFCKFVPPGQSYTLMTQARLSLATSGTVNLELALHKTPTIVTYAINKIDLFLAQKIFRINLPFYCIVNIIANKEVFPEFFGPNLTLENTLNAAKKLWKDPPEIKPPLENKNTNEKAASFIQTVRKSFT